MMSNEARPTSNSNGFSANGIHAAGGYGPPGGGGYGGPPPGGGYPPPGGGGYGGPPGGGPPPGGFGGPPPGGGGFGGPPQGGGFGPPGGGGFGGPPRGGGFGPPGGFPPPGGPMMPGAGGDVNTTLPLILNIATALLCSGACVSFILSVLGIVFAVQASTAKNAGDVETARAKAKTSMLMAIISAVLGLIAGVVITILRVLNS